ncbi:uncharacterized protein K460DRAFT_411941 [Cucurbitaria berberidis CBS 394.84]|uniref:Uncharacterized protein n=1 Tax=Cucurbitaria berberidis CBS 394.84 TaxID=1168544 RepID=A0A9P4LCP2_9PLEO|nr:uncharacterized protein K460DRAFT_411941 [Cucurbitaria berberidis CBS 394.84]KAF1850205.1 hypothetical protein K460DRAFT_411941 [Cucurbitaria berberidis CBS 394.84]
MLAGLLFSIKTFLSTLCCRRKAPSAQSRARTAPMPPEMVPLPPSPPLLPRPASLFGRRHEVERSPAVGFLPSTSSVALGTDDHERVVPVARFRSFTPTTFPAGTVLGWGVEPLVLVADKNLACDVYKLALISHIPMSPTHDHTAFDQDGSSIEYHLKPSRNTQPGEFWSNLGPMSTPLVQSGGRRYLWEVNLSLRVHVALPGNIFGWPSRAALSEGTVWTWWEVKSDSGSPFPPPGNVLFGDG